MIRSFQKHFNEIGSGTDPRIQQCVEALTPGVMTWIQIIEPSRRLLKSCLHQRTLG
ncbi:MAG: Uncharacterised protein [Synechococcus sp. MIT S9220]|nr:MAG: Uncharacterised protein [Synechococcus sp. MIT S9220]